MSVWDEIKEIENAKELICSGYCKNKIFTPDPLVEKACEAISILDFGCGIGRNLIATVDRVPTVHGYDFPNMVEMARTYLGEKFSKVHFINPPAENLLGVKVEAIIATLVFQHIPEIELRYILPILQRCLTENGKLLLSSRGYIDGTAKNIWSILLDYFDPTFDLRREDGTETHQAGVFVPRTR